MATVQDLVNQRNGTKFGITGEYNNGKPTNDWGQCTAVPHAWEQMIGLPIVYGHAFDMYANASPNQYDKELNGPNNFPLPGATVVFSPGYGGSEVGHIAVALDGCTPTKLRIIEQNNLIGGGDGRTRVWETGYTEVYGWFTPKGFHNNNDTPKGVDMWTDTTRGVSGDAAYWGQAYVERNAQWQADEAKIASMNVQINNLSAQVKSQQDQIVKLNQQIIDLGNNPVEPTSIPQDTINQVAETNSIVKQILAFLHKIFIGG